MSKWGNSVRVYWLSQVLLGVHEGAAGWSGEGWSSSCGVASPIDCNVEKSGAAHVLWPLLSTVKWGRVEKLLCCGLAYRLRSTVNSSYSSELYSAAWYLQGKHIDQGVPLSPPLPSPPLPTWHTAIEEDNVVIRWTGRFMWMNDGREEWLLHFGLR